MEAISGQRDPLDGEGRLVAAIVEAGLYLRAEPPDSSCSVGSSLFPSELLRGAGFIQKPDERGEAHPDALGFSVADCDIDVVRVTQLLLFAALLGLKEPGFGVLDASHRLHDIQADYSASILNQRLVVEKGFRFDGKLAAQLFEQLDHLLGAQIELVEMLIDRKPQRRCSRSSVAHGVLPFLLALVRNIAVAEKLSKDRVCVRTGPAGIL